MTELKGNQAKMEKKIDAQLTEVKANQAKANPVESQMVPAGKKAKGRKKAERRKRKPNPKPDSFFNCFLKRASQGALFFDFFEE